MTEQTTIKNQISGADVGVPITTETKAANTAEAGKVQNQVAEGIRKEFHQNPTIHDFNKVDAAVNKIRLASTPNSTPFQDMSAIFAFMKVLDPGSTVREGEYATVEKSRGWPEAFRAAYNRAAEGKKLTEAQKTQLAQSAEQNYQGQLQNALPVIRQFSELESKNSFAPGTVVPVEFSEKLKVTPGTAAVAPAAGGVAAPANAPAATPVISATDQTAAAAEANALPPTVEFFQWSGKTYHNPNYRP